MTSLQHWKFDLYTARTKIFIIQRQIWKTSCQQGKTLCFAGYIYGSQRESIICKFISRTFIQD